MESERDGERRREKGVWRRGHTRACKILKQASKQACDSQVIYIFGDSVWARAPPRLGLGGREETERGERDG